MAILQNVLCNAVSQHGTVGVNRATAGQGEKDLPRSCFKWPPGTKDSLGRVGVNNLKSSKMREREKEGKKKSRVRGTKLSNTDKKIEHFVPVFATPFHGLNTGRTNLMLLR